ncbi:hypothetical protein KBZ94_34770 [Streptomyces sp. RM72]|uniref:hypothetical protein n=1 Tax=Streptomyces sp. RM72 TaxID=1115510 RepID=UPI001B368F17|nr:hypothetical protein [Streptomyces sp. RM72]MBQ0890032.1 hypothetical protein [Streptomyces sp. RM72]
MIEIESCGVDPDAVEAAFTDAVAGVPATTCRRDHLEPAGVRKHDGAGRRYSPFDRGFHTDVRAAIACGLVDEATQPPYRPLLTTAGALSTQRHSADRLPDPASWEQPAEFAEAVAELGGRYAADTRGDPRLP